MNANAQKWVDALRSDEFLQVEGQLCTGGGYCCLGVACEIYRRETGRGAWDDQQRFEAGDDSCMTELPFDVRTWLGLASDSGLYNDSEDVNGTSLVELNDDHGYPFEQIADVIESAPDGLFA